MINQNDDQVLCSLERLPSASILDAIYQMWGISTQMKGVFPLIPGQKLVGRAVTVRFVPTRPDLKERVIGGCESAEYQALELCGPGSVLVMDALGMSDPSVIGDIKLLRMKQLGGAGVVTDGGIRDVEAVRAYGIGVFAARETNMTMPSHMLPCDYQTPIQCGGVLVMPGDYITADAGGVVVVPKDIVEEAIERAEELENLENAVKTQLANEFVSPGKYYPFNDAARSLLLQKD